MKKKVLLFILLFSLFITYGCSKDESISDAQKFKEEYESYNGKQTSSGKDYLEVNILEDNVIKYSSLSEVLDIVNNGTGVIYLGYPTCPWCRNMISPLLAASDSTSLDTIYYVNMHDERDTIEYVDGNLTTTKEASSEYYDLLLALDNILEEYIITDSDGIEHDTLEKRIYVPLVIFVKDGEVVSYHANTVDSQTDPYIALNDEEYLELYNIYLSGINKVLEDTCDSKC